MKDKMKNFKYNVEKLIDCVRERECLWNKDLETYKDKVERRSAWEEIFSILDENYEQMTLEERRVTGEKILNKWTNVRDTFVKSLKPKAGKPKRRYIFYDHLKFLFEVISEEECSNIVEYNFDESSAPYKQEEEHVEHLEPKTHKKRSKKSDYKEEYLPSTSKKSRRIDDSSTNTFEEAYESYEETNDYAIDQIDINEDPRSDPRIMNEDEAFFASLLPTVVKYSEDERLEFRIEVLAVMRKIRDSKKWMGPTH